MSHATAVLFDGCPSSEHDAPSAQALWLGCRCWRSIVAKLSWLEELDQNSIQSDDNKISGSVTDLYYSKKKKVETKANEILVKKCRRRTSFNSCSSIII